MIDAVRFGAACVLFVALGWVFFRAASLGEVKRIFAALSGLGATSPAFSWEIGAVNPLPAVCALAGIGYCFFIEPHFNETDWQTEFSTGWIHRASATAMLVFSVKLDAVSSVIPFLYFQF
mgnify:CR=1 FL=1